jgi:UDP-N-acetylmuramate dehydrogenase
MISVTTSGPPCPSRRDSPLSALTTIGVGGRVPWLVEPRNVDELKAAVAWARDAGLEHRMLGGGANLLVADDGLDFVVIRSDAIRFVQRDGDDHSRLRVSCGVPIPTFVQQTREMGMTGAEPLVGIPGTIGGATAMNAGGRHGWLSDIVTRVRVLTRDQQDVEIEKTESTFGYRSSNLDDAIVLETMVVLEPGDKRAIQEKIKTYLKEKSAAQPLTEKSAGCVFKNPEGGSAGKELEAAGVKGLRIGDAAVSEKHANFIVNRGAATLRDVRELVARMRRAVHDRTGILLEREVKVWSKDPFD